MGARRRFIARPTVAKRILDHLGLEKHESHHHAPRRLRLIAKP